MKNKMKVAASMSAVAMAVFFGLAVQSSPALAQSHFQGSLDARDSNSRDKEHNRYRGQDPNDSRGGKFYDQNGSGNEGRWQGDNEGRWQGENSRSEGWRGANGKWHENNGWGSHRHIHGGNWNSYGRHNRYQGQGDRRGQGGWQGQDGQGYGNSDRSDCSRH